MAIKIVNAGQHYIQRIFTNHTKDELFYKIRENGRFTFGAVSVQVKEGYTTKVYGLIRHEGKHTIVRMYNIQKIRRKTRQRKVKDSNGIVKTKSVVVRRTHWVAHVYDITLADHKVVTATQHVKNFTARITYLNLTH